MTPDPVDISDAESLVMDVLWRAQAALAAEDVIAALVTEQRWQEATIKTLLNRLLKKGAVSASKDGRRYLYSAVLKRDQWVSRESGGMLDRLFGGRVAPLVAHFGKHRKLSASDIAELKKLIEELDDGK
ncbi:BlaI/MecI/CopY family transcriptional regulator [Massilia sp. CF038]|uniref:BlaI/MecI/CopY family transcriptional regulator n=1 Tax=Massilia sp. CF038 TaxID=1881045 RepID=UPI00091C6501|nr:BlaI/MecI/CopY family transcriptional regulator [Massilia sp. CF038]SHH27847.1 Predicted transcriptional regulator [Massilia sp. CF038]